jgi:tartrate-resistant acid phosphatase type 5
VKQIETTRAQRVYLRRMRRRSDDGCFVGSQVSVLGLLLCALLAGCSTRPEPGQGLGPGPSDQVGSPVTPGSTAGTFAESAPSSSAGSAAGSAAAPVAGAGGNAASGGGAIPARPGSADDAGVAAPLPAPLDAVTIAARETGMHVTQLAGPVVRFIAIGDTGTGEADQHRVAAVMEQKCAQDGCDFVVLLGDNIYENGPTSLDDPQWQTKFEEPYAALALPFYVVLGNHDVGLLSGIGYNPAAVPLEIGYSERSIKWKMPAAHYTVSVGNVGLLMFDTNALYNHVTEQGDQHAWVGPARDALLASHDWVFAAAHHTYVSNGDHGNAGAYAYLDVDLGLEVEQFVGDHLCGQIDMLLTGHDHNRQWLDPAVCMGTDVVVSGAGAKRRQILGTNPVYFASDKLGFFYVVVEGKTLTGQFIDDLGQIDFERTLRK